MTWFSQTASAVGPASNDDPASPVSIRHNRFFSQGLPGFLPMKAAGFRGLERRPIDVSSLASGTED